VISEPVVVTEPVTVKRTVTSGVGFPEASSTVAVTQCCVPTWFVAAAGVRLSVAGGPMELNLATKTSEFPLSVVSNAPAVVGKLT